MKLVGSEAVRQYGSWSSNCFFCFSNFLSLFESFFSYFFFTSASIPAYSTFWGVNFNEYLEDTPENSALFGCTITDIEDTTDTTDTDTDTVSGDERWHESRRMEGTRFPSPCWPRSNTPLAKGQANLTAYATPDLTLQALFLCCLVCFFVLSLFLAPISFILLRLHKFID